MGFKIFSRDKQLAQGTAEERFEEACLYLRQSDLANDIIESLRSANEAIEIWVGAARNEYVPPQSDGAHGGRINWDVATGLKTVDKKSSRPDTAWTPKGGRTAFGSQTPPMGLLHEMGHALQYLSNKTDFRAAHASAASRLALEQINVAAIEATVARDLGEGVRWQYHDGG